MFSTFIEHNSTFAVKVKQQLSTLYYAQIAFGVFYFIISLIILILLFAFRKEQPISSRLATPFMGMIALLVESCLIYITQRGILVNQLKSSNNQMWESGDNDSNIIANIVTIFVNSLNLTAIFCYVIQVVRFELMKFMYKLIHKTKGNESKSDIVLKSIRISTSTSLFLLLTTLFMSFNLVYWTIWVVLRRINVIEPSTYTYIVSISYTVIIFFLSLVIATVLVFDFIITIKEKKEEKKNEPTDSTVKENLVKKSIKMKNSLSKVYDFFISLDEPLYFRVEMILYLICFVFLIVNQVIGLIGLPYRFIDEENYKTALQYDVISFIFEVLYVFTYILVFGGYALLILLIYKVKIWRKFSKNGKSKQDDGMLKNKELLLVIRNEESYESFEKFCEKEFSLENLYLHSILEKHSKIVNGETFEGLSTLLNQIFEGFIQSGATNEVNIPNSCRTKIVNLHKKYGFEKKDSDLKNVDLEEVRQAFFSLVQQVFVNLGDTFSRYSLTTEWKVFKKAIELKEHITEKANLY
ncbi:predicted protein [Naegleria gruberi]|uniref:Predicted protein n=1 Tax=Naegleria gruberi TaxID=5762 RepID=D2V7M9_NAEGR|nr:uncharacterized protein NAEGRDRAFT_64863 [Naegleria gruberi]EFC47279.1 predicted protein [Naegleria gruberi]|eukprot:XP_002680023.1 predicted protein [Naegleria gruberi strain NEG-M]